MIHRLLYITVTILLIAQSSFCATYYVDASGGDDFNTGLSPLSAWRTINKINISAFQPGDQILLKRGERWREQLIFPSSGTTGNPITIGIYGVGEKPIITGANVITNFVFHSNNVWKKVMSRPQQLYFNSIRGKYQSSVAGVDSVMEWYYDTPSGQVFVYSPGNPSTAYTAPGLEYTARPNCLTVNNDYMIFDNLHLEKTYNSSIKVNTSAQNIIFDNLTIYQWTVEQNTSIGGVDIFGNNCELRNSTFGQKTGNDLADQNWVGFIAINVLASNTKIHHNNIYHSAIENETILGSRAYGIQLSQISGVTEVYNNYVYHIGSHAVLVRSNSVQGDTIKIYDNTAEYTGQAGISAFLTRKQDGIGGIGLIYRNHISFANRNGGDVGGGGNQSAGIHLNDGSVGNTNPAQPFMKWYIFDNIVHNSQAIHKPNGNDSDGIGLDFNANEVEIFRNLVYNNWGKGIYMWNANRCRVYYNIVYGNDTGSTVTAATGTSEKADNNVIYNNTYYKNYNFNDHGPNYHTEIYFGGNGKNNLIKNNIFFAHDSSTVYTFRDKNTFGCITDNNIIYKEGGYFAWLTEEKVFLTLAEWRTNYPQWDANSIPENPQFLDALTGNFGLNSTSPAINKGIDLGFTTDFFNNPLQGAPDLGAIEYIDNTPPAVLSATYINNTSIKVLFSEKIQITDGEAASNYSINNGVSVISSSLNNEQTEATLTTSIHIPDQSFVVTVSNIKDIAGNTISPAQNSASYDSPPLPPERTVILLNAMNGAFSGDARLGSMTGMRSSRAVYFQGTNGGVTFNINIPKSGQWYAWARMYYMSSGGKNSFFLNFNGTQYILGDNDSRYNQWNWDGYLGNNISLGALNAGANTFRISGREPGLTLWVDQIVLTDDPNFIPTDQNTAGGPPPTVILFGANTGTLSGDARLGTMTGQKSSRSVYFVGTNGGVTFNINIPTSPRNWYIWARMYYMSSGQKNSFFLNFDASQYILGDNDNRYNQWHWDGYLGNKINLGVLSAGSKTMRISGREPGLTLWVDQIVITDDSSYNPNVSLGKEVAEAEIEESELIPDNFNLSQNYPNPFNPSTKIKYALPEDAFVTLIIYDVIGNEVEKLTNDYKSKGIYEVEFNGRNLASGIYYYAIRAGDFYQVRKMIMIK